MLINPSSGTAADLTKLINGGAVFLFLHQRQGDFQFGVTFAVEVGDKAQVMLFFLVRDFFRILDDGV